MKRFLMEAQSIAQFGKAKDIVNVYDFFEANNTAYIIMEYVDGVLLKDYLERQGRMEPEVALNVIHPIIEAVKKFMQKELFTVISVRIIYLFRMREMLKYLTLVRLS